MHKIKFYSHAKTALEILQLRKFTLFVPSISKLYLPLLKENSDNTYTFNYFIYFHEKIPDVLFSVFMR